MNVSRVHRLLRLITILQSGRSYTANELAGELGVSRRTVFRDLNMLELAHIPYYFDPEREGYRISSHFFLPPINLTLSEALAMLLLAGRCRHDRRLPLLSAGTQAAIKLESALPPHVRQHVGSIMDRMSISPPPAARHEGLDAMFEELVGAVASRRVCQIVYISFYEHKQIRTRIQPRRLMFIGRAWYLLAYSTMHREIRTFKLGRIRNLKVTDATFQPGDSADLEKHFGQAWCMIPEGKTHDVHLHFAPKVAGNVAEVGWHESQRVEWNDDGSIEFHVRVDGLGELAWWVLGYGDQVRVMAPPALRQQVAGVARAVADSYASEARA